MEFHNKEMLTKKEYQYALMDDWRGFALPLADPLYWPIRVILSIINKLLQQERNNSH